MYSSDFQYFRPKTVAEASKLLRKHKEARVLAGGHSLLPAMKFRLANPSALVDIGAIEGLAGVEAQGESLRIGATTTHAEVAASAPVRERCPVLAETAAQIGDIQVRNRGTIGGSVAHADPAADLPTVLIALGATFVASTPRGERQIAAGKFFVDLFSTALKPGEILTAILVPACGSGTGGSYQKHPHPASRYAVAGAAAIVAVKDGKCERVSLVVGGATPNPVRVKAAERALIGQEASAKAISRAAAKVPKSIQDPLGDHYASGEFRVHLATVLARRALTAAVEHARG